ncbi:RHS repeat-associated core domain-containing protein [Mucilaginibacter sp. UC70_90]
MKYILANQQGNARISFEDNGSAVAVVRQENSYYGFGLTLANSPVATPVTDNKQLYNGGSEWQNDYNNLPDLQQTFYRNYDAALGRWIAVDPVAESAESMTVYQYAGNNPIMLNDPLGDLLLPEGSYIPQLAPSLEQSMGDFDRHVDRFNQWAAESEDKYYTGGADAKNIYHAGDGTSADPASGVTLNSVINFFNNSGSLKVTSTGYSLYWETPATEGIGVVGHTLNKDFVYGGREQADNLGGMTL